MHFGLEQYVPLALYIGAVAAFLLSLFWKPQAGLYFLIPLLPLQTIRYRILDFPLGNKLIDMLLLGVVLGAVFKGGFRFAKTPMNKFLIMFGVFCYVQLWRGAFFLNSAMPLSISDPRFSNWKNYMVMFVIFAVTVSVIKDVKQIKIICVLMCLSVLAVNKGYYGTMSDRDTSHFSYDVRDGGALGYAGVNGVATFEAEFMLFVLGLSALQKRKSIKFALWGLFAFSAYCLLFSYSREAYAGILIGLFFLGLVRQRWVLVALAVFLFSWQSFVPVSVQERVLMTYDKNEQQLDTSAQDRVVLWDDAMNLFHQNPALGAGFDTYEWQHRVGIYTDTHNYFLKVLVETGVLGLMLFLFLLAKMTRLGVKLYRTAQDPFLQSIGLGFSLLMACVFVVNFFGDRWLYVEVNGFLWVMLACVVRGQMIESVRKEEPVEVATEAPPGASTLGARRRTGVGVRKNIMCGIFGQIGSSPADEKCGLELHHRGPDDAGLKYFTLSNGSVWVSLQHRRLSIIDLSSAGHQPMCNEDESIWITFNGEIYNFQELRTQLVSAGHAFRSHTDTEVVIHGYEEWGTDVVKKLRGMFAFAIWDNRHRRMLLATDHLGKKPLFYSHNDAGRKFIFASEIKAILQAGVPAELDPVAMHDYLTYLYFPYPSTAFKHVRKMAPGSAMEIVVDTEGDVHRREWKYWDAAETAGTPLQMSEAGMIDRARDLMEESVKLRMISDVPLGLFLSGGLDSSAITAFAAKNSPEQIKTFTIGFQNSKFYDEQPVAKMVAERFNTEHHILQADEACAAYMTDVVRHFDEPFGNPTAILEYIITKQMRKHVTVAISGDGGDELFGGYVRYAGAALARRYRQLPQFVTKGLVSRLSGFMSDATDGRHGFRRVREFAQSAWQAEEDMYIDWVGYFSESEKQELYTPDFSASVGVRNSGDFLRQFFRRGAKLDPISRLGYVDSASFLCCNCLEYADRMSMANSLEVRAPFTDYRLLEFAMQVPQRLKVRNMTTKWITRQAMRNILPQEVINKKKMGFNPPLPQWINGELKPVIRELLSPAAIERRGLFRPDAVQKLLRDHAENRRDNALKIWSLLMIEVWQRMYFDKQSAESVLESAMDDTKRRTMIQAGHTEKHKADVICIQ